MSQTRWRKSPDCPTRQFTGEGMVHSVCERACGERMIKPPLSNKGGIKNKRQETKVSGNAEYIRENPVL